MAPKRKGGAEEEEAFPRGGGTGLTPVVQKQLQKEAYDEARAELLGEEKGKRKKSRRGQDEGAEGDEEDAYFHSLSVQGRLPAFVELLKFKSLSVGSKLWGAVVEVRPRELVVSLPHGLRGHVGYAAASDTLAELSRKAAKGTPGAADLPPLTALFGLG